MVDKGLLEAVGEKRGRYYLAGEELLAIRSQIRSDRPPRATEDPFEIVSSGRQLRLLDDS
jgi:hypothetical protein